MKKNMITLESSMRITTIPPIAPLLIPWDFDAFCELITGAELVTPPFGLVPEVFALPVRD